MSAPTYTVTKDNGSFAVRYGKRFISRWQDRETADAQAHSLNVHEHAFAMLALLVESQATPVAQWPESWFERRDALIAQITGEPNE